MPESLFFLGKTTYPQKSLFAILITPFAQLKILFKTLYLFIVKIMWSELIYGQKKENELAGILLFLIFLLLSWLTYLGKIYFPWILTSFFIIWYLDYGLAKAAYQKGEYNIPVYLLQTDDNQLVWQSALPNRPPSKIEFNWTQIREIKISQFSIYGGAFQEKLGRVWQISLKQFDGVEWIIDEAKTVPQALYQAKIFQQWVNAPIIFSESQGLGNYAEFALNEADILSSSQMTLRLHPHQHPEQYAQYQKLQGEIKKHLLKESCVNLQKSQQKWHIYSTWKLINTWQLFKQILQDSGFIIFILIISRIMLIFGSVVDGFWVNQDIKDIAENFQFSSGMFFPVAIAVVIMIYKGWQLSRVKHCFLDQHFLKATLDNQVLGKLNLAEIEAVLLLTNPKPEILIFTLKDAIILPKLQREEDSKLYLSCLQDGINYFQNLNHATGSDL